MLRVPEDWRPGLSSEEQRIEREGQMEYILLIGFFAKSVFSYFLRSY
jgi:hypothetical protein